MEGGVNSNINEAESDRTQNILVSSQSHSAHQEPHKSNSQEKGREKEDSAGEGAAPKPDNLSLFPGVVV